VDGVVEMARGLEFPEGPVAMPDGSVVLVEMMGERLTRVRPNGTTETVAEVPGGPNGLAVGPEGALYVCNNGKVFSRVERGDLLLPGPFDPDRYTGGRIERVEPRTGAVSVLYTECDGRPLRAPNDLVMDGHGGFWFTDHGRRDVRHARSVDLTGIYYARCDGSSITEAIFPAESPNGIGLSPTGDRLYWAETFTGRLYHRAVTGPGQLAPAAPFDPAAVLYGAPGLRLFDSLAVDGEGWINVATLIQGGITSVSPDGEAVEFLATDDLATTNLCLGGDDRSTAFVTLSATGRLVAMPWPRPGHRLAHQ
jgi:gluconolactonase